jgi:hypothetical protein
MKCPPSWIFGDMHVASQQGSRNIFIWTTTNHFALKIILCMPFEIPRSLETFKTSTNQYLVSNECFYMVNPCCDVTKTTVNEIKNVSKMADLSLLQVKIFQELSKICRIGKEVTK